MSEIKLPIFSDRPPAIYADRLNFRKDRWFKMQAGLFVLAQTGYSVASELQDLLGSHVKVETDSYALSRIFREYLPEAGLAEYSVLPFFRFGLGCIRLTEFGEQVCRSLGWAAKQSEWGKLLDGHDGANQPNHTAMILMFARQARLRGYRVKILPDVKNKMKAFAPDVYVVDKKHRRAYVEIERGHDKHDKWRSLAAMQGFVAFATLTSRHRQTLVEEIQSLGLPGRATDLQTLLRGRQNGGSNWLFLQRWDSTGRNVEQGQLLQGR